MNGQTATISHARDTVLDLLIRFGPRLLTAVLILAVGIAVSRWVSRWLAGVLSRRDLEPPVRLLLTRTGAAICLLLFVVLALQNLGVELLPLIAGLSVAGAAVALATQGILSNMAAGLTIIFAKPYRVGEYIAIAGVEGVVETISLFSTTLGHVDRSHVVVPNRKIAGEILQNYGNIRQLDVSVSVAYDIEIEVPLAVIREVLRSNPRVLKEPEPVVQTAQLGNSSVAIAVRPWVLVEDQVRAPGEVYAALLDAFRARGIVIPVTQAEVRLIGRPEVTNP
ncbi:MAG: mechanosensitive ion channel family protein [Gammaproteobacteria bacterium]|nr:mechanosensitive ion channel family protein [Gammaproteobacteria bacterium]